MTRQPCSATSRRAFLCHVAGAIAGMGMPILSPRGHGQNAQKAGQCQPRVAAANPHVADVRDFGAIGDGKTDDSPALKAAVDSLANTRGVVRLKNGTVYGIRVG